VPPRAGMCIEPPVALLGTTCWPPWQPSGTRRSVFGKRSNCEPVGPTDVTEARGRQAHHDHRSEMHGGSARGGPNARRLPHPQSQGRAWRFGHRRSGSFVRGFDRLGRPCGPQPGGRDDPRLPGEHQSQPERGERHPNHWVLLRPRTGKKGIWDLAKGTVTVNNSAIVAIIKSPTWGTSHASSCSFDGVAKGLVTIVSGTGAYMRITGSLTFTLTEAGQGPLLNNGKCNEASNAQAVAQYLIGIGSGNVSFK
jgi:hypothetical protein